MRSSGNRSELSRAELAERERGDVSLDPTTMEPPAWLPDGLRGEFAALAATLTRLGAADGAFSDAAARLVVCSRDLAVLDGMLDAALEGRDSAEVARVQRMQNTAFGQWRSMLNDLGLTPRTCSYLRRDRDEKKPANPFADLVGGG